MTNASLFRNACNHRVYKPFGVGPNWKSKVCFEMSVTKS
jgi:hypothetical protein